jgi:hypothetical protein
VLKPIAETESLSGRRVCRKTFFSGLHQGYRDS